MKPTSSFIKSQITLLTKITLIALIIVLSGINANATIGNAIANSNWTSTSTWSFSGTNRLPNCGDTMSIGSTKTVTVNSQIDYTACSSPMIIYVYGTLQFTNGNKLDLPCGSVVFIMSGGTVKKSTAGGGSSTLISICGTVEWKAGDGPLSGVDTLGYVSPLPIDLLSFDAVQEKESVKISWTTATEINNSYFEVEKSHDGKEFYRIGKVDGAGNSTFARSYSFDDNAASEGVNYYRLKQVDYDGKSETFSPVALKFKSNKKGIILFENPFNSSVKFALANTNKGEVNIKLINSEGREVYSSVIDISESNIISITGIEDLPSGNYFIMVTDGKQIFENTRVIKQ